MKKFISHRIQLLTLFFSFLILSQLFSGCQKSPINGDLDGHWQVMKVTPAPTEEIITTRLYMGFYLHVCQLYYVNGGGWTAGNMHYEGDKLSLDFPYAIDNETAEIMLRQYGINSPKVTFTVETLTKNRMVLRDGETVVELRKY